MQMSPQNTDLLDARWREKEEEEEEQEKSEEDWVSYSQGDDWYLLIRASLCSRAPCILFSTVYLKVLSNRCFHPNNT